MMKEVTPQYLRSRLTYNPDDGSFIWREQDPNLSERPSRVKSWNTRYAGTRAENLTLRGYLDLIVDCKKHKAHRVAWFITYGEWPNGQIDHIDGNRINNIISNLRVVTDAENRRNMGMRSDNTSGVTGVTYSKAAKKWQAQYRLDGKNYYLGLYDTVEDAAKARAKASNEQGFHENHGSIRNLKKYQKKSSVVCHV